MQGWLILVIAVAYLSALFAIASYGDHRSARRDRQAPRPYVYALSIGVYCTSWTFFGSVGLATTNGFEYLAIFTGPILVYTLGMPLLRRIMHLSKNERITSIADFLASRYGKNARVAAMAAAIAVLGTVPYIALQLKAISDSVSMLASHYASFPPARSALDSDIALVVAFTLALFAILFGTRHADATEHQDGLILAVAVESVVKLAAFLLVGIAITFFLFGGASDIADAIANDPAVGQSISNGTDLGRWLVVTLLSACAIIALPRQFHVTFVENRANEELSKARWLFPLYLIVINLLVFPVAVAGMQHVGAASQPDLYMIVLPLAAGQDWLAIAAFTGGLSAATAMVIVGSVALSIMISNDLVIPAIIWRFGDRLHNAAGDWSRLILNIRRLSIIVVMIASFLYFEALSVDQRLASIGLLSFAAIAQFAPAIIIGLTWRGANARGAIWGLGGGIAVWAYTLLVPQFVSPDAAIVREGLWGLEFMKPESLFYTEAEPLIHGVLWSLAVNCFLVVAGSMSREPTPLERVQAISFVPRDANRAIELKRFTSSVTVGELKSTLARYIGQQRTQRAFWSLEAREGRLLHDHSLTDMTIVHHAEQTLASAIGSASARLVLSLLLKKDTAAPPDTVRLLDNASAAIQQNRNILQTALDQLDQGVSIFDRELRLTNWNGQFRRLLGLGPDMGQFGMPLKMIVRRLVDDGQITPDTELVAMERIPSFQPAWSMALRRSGRIMEVRSNPMPDGGMVVTYTEITGRVEAEEALRRARDSLEHRVQIRTAELTNVNKELANARRAADEANQSKTRFLAAAGHDITQPLNAARLYASALVERMDAGDHAHRETAHKIDSALESVETIIGAVLDISRLDAGALTPNISTFALDPMIRQLRDDFAPMAERKGIELKIVATSAWVRTDRNLFRRLLQNLISNAIKYTKAGRVLVGVRRSGTDRVSVVVQDTGIGISPQKARTVFREFERLQEGAKISSGLGLGLSIVDRISRVLDLPIDMRSQPERGTRFTAGLPRAEPVIIPARTGIDAPAAASPMRSLLNGLVIACVDNEEGIVAGMTMLLEGWGACVIAATSQDGLMKAIDDSGLVPDVLLADYHLDDDLTGLDLIDALRAKVDAALPALLITADRSAEVRGRATEADVTILNKPLKPAALRASLTSLPRPKREAAE